MNTAFFRNRKKLCGIWIFLALCFIWGQSLLPPEQSSKESSFVMEKIVEPVFGDRVEENLVRKSAHVLEFTALGAGLGLFFEDRRLFRTLSAGMAAALLDETIQRFTGRGSAVTDIWIDTLGVVLGFLLSLLIAALFRTVRRRTEPDGNAETVRGTETDNTNGSRREEQKTKGRL